MLPAKGWGTSTQRADALFAQESEIVCCQQTHSYFCLSAKIASSFPPKFRYSQICLQPLLTPVNRYKCEMVQRASNLRREADEAANLLAFTQDNQLLTLRSSEISPFLKSYADSNVPLITTRTESGGQWWCCWCWFWSRICLFFSQDLSDLKRPATAEKRVVLNGHIVALLSSLILI